MLFITFGGCLKPASHTGEGIRAVLVIHLYSMSLKAPLSTSTQVVSIILANYTSAPTVSLVSQAQCKHITQSWEEL